jgi:hypothetical protein
MNKLTVAGVVGGLVIVGISIAYAVGILPKSKQSSPSDNENSSVQGEAQRKTKVQGEGAGIAAMKQAAQEKKYLFAFFWKDESSETANLKKVFEEAMQKVGDRANSIQVCISDSSESGIIETFDLKRAPMPLALAIAPNGAIMGGFPQKFDEDNLLNAFGSPCTEQCMKTMQDGNLVLLCVQNQSTTSNEEAMKGVNDPSVILADEPTGNLDPETSQQVIRFFEEVNAEGKTIVMVTHDPRTAERAKHTLRITNGAILSDVNSNQENYHAA